MRQATSRGEAQIAQLTISIGEITAALEEAHAELNALRQRMGGMSGSPPRGTKPPHGSSDPATTALVDPAALSGRSLNAADAMAQIRSLQVDESR